MSKQVGRISSKADVMAAGRRGLLRYLGRLAHQSLSVVLSALLLLQPMIANAQSVSASSTGAVANQPHVGAAPNGVPLIDIVTPNAQGLSHNKYDDFNVGTPGLILNNSNAEVGISNLGGATPGNPNLKNSGPAAVILNEVTSGNRSALNGPTEVFGGRADVIIANPNGITCDGCGFINTPHATLTTGTPDIGSDGRLNGFTVNGGDVMFQGSGGNFAAGAGAVDLFDVVSRNIHINAPVYGKSVRLTGGAGSFDYATGEATALTATSGTPEYAIDGSALGAMQADQIKIVVTEKGAGVNMSGAMAANTGELSLSADGKISIGKASGQQGLTIASKSKVTAGQLTSKGKISVKADQGITLQSIAADSDIALSSGSGLLSVAGDINTGGVATLTSGADISIADLVASGAGSLSASGYAAITGAASTGGALTITTDAGDITAASLLSYDNISLTAGRDITVAGKVLAQGNIAAAGRNVSADTIVAGLDITATQADPNGNMILADSGNITLAASANVTATSILSASDLTERADLVEAGDLISHGSIDITGGVDVSDQLLGAGDVRIDGNGSDIDAKLLVSGVDFVATDAAGGNIVLGQDGDLTLATSGAITAPTMLAAGTLSATASDISAVTVSGQKDISLGGSDSINVSGQILGANNVSLSGATIQANQIVTGVDFAATAQSPNGAIALGQSGDLTINGGNATTNNALIAGNLDVSGTAYTAGNITGYGDLTINASTDITGQLLAAGNVSITGASIGGDAIVSGVDLAATSQAADGNIVLGQSGNLTLNATAGDMDVSALLAAGSADLAASGNVSANVVAHGDMTITAGGAIDLSGQSLAAGDTTLGAQSMTVDTLVSGLDFAATAASASGQLMLQTGSTMTLNASAGSVSANVLLSGGDIAAAATQNIGYTSLQSLGDTTISAPGNISYNNATRIGGNLTIDTGAFDLSSSTGSLLAVGGALAVDASSANLAGSSLTLGGLTLNVSGNADVTNAKINAVTNAGGSGDIAISGANISTNASTAVLASHDLSLTLSSLTNSGQIAAGNNLTFNIGGNFTNGATGLLFAGNDADLYVGGVLDNNRGAILAGNSLTIAANAALQRNSAVVNTAGLIQSGAGMAIYTGGLTNTSATAPQINRNVEISDTILDAYDLLSEDTVCTFHCDGVGQHDEEDSTVVTATPQVHQVVTEDQLISAAGAGAKIISGGDLTIDTVNLNNAYSAIEAGGNMALTVSGTLSNQGTTLNHTVQTICDSSTACQYYGDLPTEVTEPENCSGPNRPCTGGGTETVYEPNPNGTRDASQDLQPGTTVAVSAIGLIGGSIQARGALTINAGAVSNGASGGSIAGQVAVSAPSAQSNPLTALNGLTAGGALFSVNSSLAGTSANAGASGTLLDNLNVAVGGSLTQILQSNGANLASLAKPQSGGVGGTVPGQVFLFETRADYLDVSKFYGSAYFIDRIGYTPETSVPFLGDAYFENQLIDEQLRQQVGVGLGASSAIAGDNAIDQMKTLLDNGVAYAEANGLALGQALTPDQVANLTQSMVVYQTKTVDGAQVLVPVVYLSAADKASIASSGATIAGGSVSITAGSVDNSGAIAAAGDLTVNATAIKANGGTFLSGGGMNLDATNGIVLAAQTMNIGGQTIVAANGGATSGGALKLDAGAGSLTLAGSKVGAGGTADLSGQSVTIAAVAQDNGGTNALVGSTLTTGGDLAISGTDGIDVIASTAAAGGDLSLTSSSGAIDIVSGGSQNTTVSVDHPGDEKGATAQTTTSATSSLTQQGSSLSSGGSMLISGDRGILIAGSSLDAGGAVALTSTNGDVAIAASQNQEDSSSRTGNRYGSSTSSSTVVTNNGSSITSGNGGVAIEADNGSIGVIGSQIAANGGAATLTAKGDITIGQATDSGSTSGQAGSTKTSETVSIAEGSSISGQTGLNIVSTDGNVVLSASQITAGDASHTADVNIQAAGNVVIASGKDTDETTSDSKSSGFLSSKKTHTHTYDEENVASSVTGSGNVTIGAGGEAVISGSDVSAGGNLALSGSTVTVMGAEETHESDKQTKKSGIGVGSGGGFVSIYGSKSTTNSESETDNIGSALSSGGTTSITSTQGDVNIFGSSSHSDGGTAISSARDVNIAPGAVEQSSSSETKRSGFGINFSSGSGSVSIGIGVAKAEEAHSKDANTNAVSSLDSNGGITVIANRDINDQSGQISADGAIGLIAGHDVNMLSSNDVTNASEMQKQSFAGLSVTVSSSLIGAAQSAISAATMLSGDNSAYGIAPAVLAGYNGYKALSSALPTIEAAKDTASAMRSTLASVSITAGYSFSESASESTTSIPVPPTISGSSVSIIAESGDVIGRGAQISAGTGKDGLPSFNPDDPNDGNVLISAAGNVDMESVQATTDSSGSGKSGSVSVGYSWNLGVGSGSGFSASGSYGTDKSISSSVTQVNSNVSGTNTVTVASGDTLTLAGAVLSGNTVNATAANGIVIESRQDTATYDEKSKNASLSIGPSDKGAVIGGSYNQGTVTGDYANVSQQSGIFAGSGGYHVGTAGTIDLTAGFIGSTANAANNDLSADQIVYSNLANSMSASSTSYGITLLGGIPVPVVAQPAKQGDQGETLATVTPGDWNLTNQSQELSGLNTDASKANNTVDQFDIDKLKAQQQSAAALSQLLNEAIGDLAKQMQWDEGSPQKVALHAIAGALVAELAGGNVAEEAAAAGLEEFANGILQDVFNANPQLQLDGNDRAVIGEWLAAAVGAAVGGTGGAAASLDNFNYNFIKHSKLDPLNKKRADIENAIAACQAAAGTTSGCSDGHYLDLLQQLLDATSSARQLSDMTNVDLIKICGASFSSPACVDGRADLMTSLDDDAGEEQRILQGGPSNEPDVILSQILADVDAGKISPDQIQDEYITRLRNSSDGAFAAIAASLAIVGAPVAPQIYAYCMFANPQACMSIVAASGCLISSVCPESAPGIATNNAALAEAELEKLAIGAQSSVLNLNSIVGPASFVIRPALSIIARNDGSVGEQLALQTLEDATGLNFRSLQNGSNNGIDLIAIDPANKVIWAPEVKSSTIGQFPDPNSLDLLKKTEVWISGAASGQIAGQQLTETDIAYADQLQTLLDQGYSLKPMVVNVSIPPIGQSGSATAVIIPIK
jgi:filamentous hemagglutinin